MKSEFKQNIFINAANCNFFTLFSLKPIKAVTSTKRSAWRSLFIYLQVRLRPLHYGRGDGNIFLLEPHKFSIAVARENYKWVFRQIRLRPKVHSLWVILSFFCTDKTNETNNQPSLKATARQETLDPAKIIRISAQQLKNINSFRYNRNSNRIFLLTLLIVISSRYFH